MRKLTHHAIMIISLLIAYLIKDVITHYLEGLKKMSENPYLGVALGMLVIVGLFYPLYEFFKHLAKGFMGSYFRRSKRITNSSFGGLFFGLLIALAVLYGVYAQVWYEIDIISDIRHWIEGQVQMNV